MSDNEEEVIHDSDRLTADLAAAWDAAETDDGDQSEGGSVHESYEQSSNAQGTDWGDASVSPDSDAGDEGAVQRGENLPGGVDQVAEEDDKPPVGLSLEAREEWGNTPPAVQKAIQQREKDYEAGIVKYSQNAKRAEAMDRSLQPYAQLFAMNGGAGNTLPGLLQTASQLQMGSGPQKAQAVANIIQQFGIDIRTLDNLLVGKDAPAEVQQQSQMEEMFNQRLGPLQQQLQQYQQRDQYNHQQAQQQVAGEIQSFGSQHEFYADVRADMADLMDMAANRGRQMGLEEAYNTACAAHPQISKIMSGRQSQETVQKKRQAASSIHGSPGGAMGGAQPGSVEQALNDAWDNAGQM